MIAVTRYNKTIVAVLGAVLVAVSPYINDSRWSPVVAALIAAFGVYQTPNKLS